MYTDGKSRTKIYLNTGTPSGYNWTFLVNGLGTKISGYSNAKQINGKETAKMSFVLAGAQGAGKCIEIERSKTNRGVFTLDGVQKFLCSMVQVRPAFKCSTALVFN